MIPKIYLVYHENIDCALFDKCGKMHLFTLDIREQYGSAFVCKTLDEGISEPLRILLQVDMSVPECPFCHSKNKKIQKNGTRTVIDLFEPDDPNGRLYDDDITNACVVAARVTYENPTFRCGDCKRLYKIPRPFLSENPKSPFTARTVAMIENWKFNGISLKKIVEKLTEYSKSPVSESTVYQLLEGATANPDLTRLPPYVLLENKNKGYPGRAVALLFIRGSQCEGKMESQMDEVVAEWANLQGLCCAVILI